MIIPFLNELRRKNALRTVTLFAQNTIRVIRPNPRNSHFHVIKNI